MKCYHYTNPESYFSMKTGHHYGQKGLIPIKRFVKLGIGGPRFPKKGYDGIIEGLLEPEPISWTNNLDYPFMFGYLMHDICRRKEVMLLSFDILESDDAYIVDRSKFEDVLYMESKGLGKPTDKDFASASRKFYYSRKKALEYNGNYKAPQFAIWTPIEFERLNIEWIKPTEQVWKRVLENKWY